MKLAVATHDPNAVAETYVRQHMRLIRPGATVGIGLQCDGEPIQSLPFFCVKRGANRMQRKLETIGAYLRTGYSAGLPGREERRLAAFLRDQAVGAILAEFGTTGCALRTVAVRLGIPLYVNFHGYDATVLGQRRDIRQAYSLLARDAAGIICGSRHFSDILQRLGFDQEKISVVPCGVEVDNFNANGPKEPGLVVAVGRLTRKKRPDLSLRAFAKAHEALPQIRLCMIGDGPERGTCEALIGELGLGEAVTLMGAQSHQTVIDTLARASAMIQHSVTAENGDQESQGISLLEAMACGTPVVTTDHNGFSETVLHGETGFLGPEQDVDAMAQHLTQVLGDAELAQRLGSNGRRRVEDTFDARKLSRRLDSILFGDATDVAVAPEPVQAVS